MVVPGRVFCLKDSPEVPQGLRVNAGLLEQDAHIQTQTAAAELELILRGLLSLLRLLGPYVFSTLQTTSSVDSTLKMPTDFSVLLYQAASPDASTSNRSLLVVHTLNII